MENQAREISIGKLLWRIMLSWRLLLAGALAVSVLLSALFYMKEYKNYQAALNWKPAVADGEKTFQFTNEEQEQLQNAVRLQQLIDENQTYLDESVWMNIDPYKEDTLVLQYYVESDYRFNYAEENSLDYTSAVVASYSQYIQGGELAENILESFNLDCDKKYIQELIRINNDIDMKMLSVEFFYPDQEVLQEIGENIKVGINSQTAEIAEKVGSHSLKLLSENILVRTDTELVNKKKFYSDMLYSYRTQLNALKTTMIPEQREKLELERITVEEGKVGTPQTAPTAIKPSISVKYIVVGFVIGFFLAAIWVVGRVLFTASLQDSEELSEIYGLRLFGTLQSQKKISALDKLLLKWKNRHRKQMTLEQSMDIIASNIELTCESEHISSIYLTGSEIEKADEELLTQLIDKMKKAGIEVVYGENICYDAASLRKVAQMGTAVLVEQAGTSKYQEIKKEITVIVEQKVKILGCVGIDAIRG